VNLKIELDLCINESSLAAVGKIVIPRRVHVGARWRAVEDIVRTQLDRDLLENFVTDISVIAHVFLHFVEEEIPRAGEAGVIVVTRIISIGRCLPIFESPPQPCG
jgi:hypothetical protein